jgi:hypothetical protein
VIVVLWISCWDGCSVFCHQVQGAADATVKMVENVGHHHQTRMGGVRRRWQIAPTV